jgi:hypothetical protein
VNLKQQGIVVDWLLPLVPAVVGALAHQGGMMVERIGRTESTLGPAAAKPVVAPKPTAPTTVEPAVAAPMPPEPVVGVAPVPGTMAPVAVPPLTTNAKMRPMRVTAMSADTGEPVLLSFSPEADCATVAAARTAAAAVAASGKPVLSPYHAAVALPPNVTTYKHAKPVMPVSAALAARADLAHVADALGTDCLTESHLHQ